MTSLTEFLFPAPARRTTGAIIGWWERRRLAYNLWVGAAGLVSLGAFGLATLLVGGNLFWAIWVPAAVFGTMANVCYLLGPATEILIQAIWGRRVLPTGPMLFRIGLTFSVGLALFPSLLAVLMLLAWIVGQATGMI
jgi:hypothetical protein